MLFHAFKMAVSIASLRVNASDQIQPLNLHFLDQALFFQIYIDGPPGVPGVSKNQNFISTYESVHFLADKTYRIGFLGFQVWVFGGSSSSVLILPTFVGIFMNKNPHSIVSVATRDNSLRDLCTMTLCMYVRDRTTLMRCVRQCRSVLLSQY